jgi:hypothetical protein
MVFPIFLNLKKYSIKVIWDRKWKKYNNKMRYGILLYLYIEAEI